MTRIPPAHPILVQKGPVRSVLNTDRIDEHLNDSRWFFWRIINGLRPVIYLSEKNGAGEGTRTPDPIITNDVLYQLSYTGILLRRPKTTRDPLAPGKAEVKA